MGLPSKELLAKIEERLKTATEQRAKAEEGLKTAITLLDKLSQSMKIDAQLLLVRKAEAALIEGKRLLDVQWIKFSQLKAAEEPQVAASLQAQISQIAKEMVASADLAQQAEMEVVEWAIARLNATKDEATQVLRQLGYTPAEAKKAVDGVWEKYGPMETAAEVVRKVFEKGPPRP